LNILVSLDGSREWHNHVHGRKYAFDRAMETLRVLSKKRKNWNLNLAVNQTIVDQQSIAEYRYLHELLKKKTLRIMLC